MKIVHLMGYFVPELGYQEYYLAKKHKDMGHDVYVIASDMLYPFPNIETMLEEAGIKNTSRKRKAGFSIIEGIKVYRLKTIFEYSDFVLVSGLKRTLEKIKPDVVFAHESRQGLPALAAYYKNRIGYKLIVDQHDFYHKIPDHPWWKRVLRYLDYFLFRKFIVDYSLSKADRIVAVTKETKDFLINTHKINPQKVFMIPLGVDTYFFRKGEKARSKIRKKFGIRNDDVVLIFSGTIVRRKSLELLINAFSELKAKNSKLLIVGGGDVAYMHELKDLASKLKVQDKILFAGFVKRQEVPAYFSAADIGVWPGNNSVSIMEAMACKLPIVMVNLQLSHLVRYKNGLKFQEHNREELKTALKKLIDNKNLRLKMANNSVSAIKKDYSYDAIAKEFLDAAKS